MITAYHHPGFEAPLGESHVMPIRKFRLVAQEVEKMPGIRLDQPSPVLAQDLMRVHAADYMEAVRTGVPRALAESQKFPWSSGLYPSVCLTNGGCVAAGKRALNEGVAACIASGFHHAHGERGEGFCTFNGLVVASEILRAEGLVERVAVLDLDLHYGNGTALLAETRPWLRALSIYGNDYWNNTAFRDVSERHHYDAINHHSVPLPAGSNGTFLNETLDRELPWLLQGDRPDLLFYQAGADPYRDDPFSPLDLGHPELRERDRRVFAFCKAHGIPVAWVLAGGYTEDVSQVIEVHLNTFRAALDVYGS